MASINPNYGKIDYDPTVSGDNLFYAPKHLRIGNRIYTNPTQAQYYSQGWKHIIWGELPDDTLFYDMAWEETETEIQVFWVPIEEILNYKGRRGGTSTT